MIREQFIVQGMTCSHCVASVTEEVTAIDGVESVSIDLNAGGPSNIMVVSTKPISVADVRSAVTEAGYELVPA
jgi:copper chaperone